MNFEFTSLFFVRLLSAFFALGLVIVLRKKRATHGVLFLILFEFSAALWALSEGFEHAATTLQLKLIWAQIGYLGSSTTTVFFLLFTMAYTLFEKYVRKGFISLLMVIPILTILLVFTNPLHHWIWKAVDFYHSMNENV